jgi:hypothetical protein
VIVGRGIQEKETSEKSYMSYSVKNEEILLKHQGVSEANPRYYDAIVAAVRWHREMLDVALAESIKPTECATR